MRSIIIHLMDVIEIVRPPVEPRTRPLVDQLATLDHPELASVLAGLDRRALSGEHLLEVIAAEARHLAWVQAGMAASLSEFAHCPPYVAHPSARLQGWQEFAGDEAAIVLKVSPTTGSDLVGQSIEAHRRHPHLWAAWRDGQIDHRKVAVVTRTTGCATDDVKAAVDASLFDRSARLGRLSARDITIGQTPEQLQRRAPTALVAAGPTAARVRTRTALKNRRLVHGTDHEVPGVGYLSGCDIPLTDIAAAYAHVDAIARGIKQWGDPRLLDQLRADVFIDLLIGNHPSPEPRPRDGITTRPTKNTARADPRTTDGESAASSSTSHGSTRRPDPDTTDTDSEADTDGLEPDIANAVLGKGKSRTRTVPGARSLVDLVVPIGMLAHLSDAIRRGAVAEVAGFGLVPADVIARLVKQAASQPSTWCLTAVDGTGRVVKHVRSQHDPTKAMSEFVDGRDRHCRFPGCTRGATNCDTDQTIPAHQGGPTCPCNLSPLCRRHHRLKQARGWRLVIEQDTNEARWTTPHRAAATAPAWVMDPAAHPPF